MIYVKQILNSTAGLNSIVSYNWLTKVILYVDFWLSRKWMLLTPILLEGQLYILSKYRSLFDYYKIMYVLNIMHAKSILLFLAFSLNIECLRYIYMDIYRMFINLYCGIIFQCMNILLPVSSFFFLSSVHRDF